MKKITILLMTTCLLLMFYPVQLKSETATPATNTTMVVPKPPESAEAKALLLRLDEINAMDKSILRSPEKQALRQEVRTIKHRLQDIDGGVYISAGAVIIILLLIIILV